MQQLRSSSTGRRLAVLATSTFVALCSLATAAQAAPVVFIQKPGH
jgi:hypothetical protein